MPYRRTPQAACCGTAGVFMVLVQLLSTSQNGILSACTLQKLSAQHISRVAMWLAQIFCELSTGVAIRCRAWAAALHWMWHAGCTSCTPAVSSTW